MEFHDAANIFPMMADEEYNALVTDIKAHGQLEPVWLYQGKIIDGRNRYNACVEAGIEPHYRTWEGNESDLVGFILSLNLQRRHLTSSQKAILAVSVEQYYAIEAKQHMSVGGKGLEKVPNPIHAAKKTAALVGTNAHYVTDAKRVMEQAPELGDAVRRGLISLPDATVVAKMPEEQRQAVLEKVSGIDGFFYPNKTKRAIEIVQRDAYEEAWRRRQAAQQAQWEAMQNSEAYTRQEEESRERAAQYRKQQEERERVEAEQQAVAVAEIRQQFHDPDSAHDRSLLYETAREVNMQMKQAARAYVQFLVRFHELAGWVTCGDREPPDEWYRSIGSYNSLIQNMGQSPTLDMHIEHLYLNFRIKGVAGSYNLDLINIEALQQWIEDPSAEE